MSSLNLMRAFEDDMRRAQFAFDRRLLDDGLTILDRYKGLLSIDIDYMVLYSRLLHSKGDVSAAETILVRALEINSSYSPAIILRAQCLTSLDRRRDALAVLTTGRTEAPDDVPLLAAYLSLLLNEHGPAIAIDALRKEYQRNSKPQRLGEAVEKLRQKALSLYSVEELLPLDTENLLELVESKETNGRSLRKIYEMFESVGCNCEFGSAQRKGGAEPFSLFRWTLVHPETLINLLSADLAGYDNSENYSLQKDTTEEYILFESQYGTKSHTSVYHGDISEQEFLNRLIRRQSFLKRKFLADAAQGSKIFTYKSDIPISETQMAEIEAQMKRLGVRHVLFVMPINNNIVGGDVFFTSETRSVGYLSSVLPNTQFREWDKIVIAVHDRVFGSTK
jgi:tetratricopeptide (TPR) repeat protein